MPSSQFTSTGVALNHLIQRGLISREDGSWYLSVPLEAIDIANDKLLWRDVFEVEGGQPGRKRGVR